MTNAMKPDPRPSAVNMSADIVRATTDTELDHVRGLMRDFVTWHRSRHHQDIALINRYFNEATFNRELDELPGAYAPPHGALLVAYHRGQSAGCVALRNLGLGICEMKRMFVADAYRGLGLGRALAGRVMAQAREIGYRTMRLDTGKRQTEAIRLYESSGFRRIEPYYAMPPEMRDWLVFYEREL